MPQSVPSIDYLHDYTEDIFKENNKRIANPTVIGAELFDITKTYAVGDYVFKDGELYKCKTAHTGAWVAADFDSTDIMNEAGSGGGRRWVYINLYGSCCELDRGTPPLILKPLQCKD